MVVGGDADARLPVERLAAHPNAATDVEPLLLRVGRRRHPAKGQCRHERGTTERVERHERNSVSR